ncbi:MAG: hypothetical protein ACE5JN_16395 [Candidatus Methylomirabilia bacterium]
MQLYIVRVLYRDGKEEFNLSEVLEDALRYVHRAVGQGRPIRLSLWGGDVEQIMTYESPPSAREIEAFAESMSTEGEET